MQDKYPDDEIEVLNREDTIKKGIHAAITIKHENHKRFTFLNAGFPANFDGKMECLPTNVIQATHCLMYEATREALEMKHPGFMVINPDIDEWIYQNALNEIQ